ncbi:MAG: hypothetical protein U0704_08095 [Candidatus Eisenbacteria bacterium]
MAPQPAYAGLGDEVSVSAHARHMAAWSVTAVVLAAGADALGLPWRPFGVHVAWIECAAVFVLAGACLVPGAWREAKLWRTPLDGRVLCALLLASLQLLPVPRGGEPAFTLRQAMACSAIYFGLVAQARAGRMDIERLWLAFALAATLASAHVLFAITGGVANLRAASDAADAAWGAHGGLFKSLLFTTLLVCGRALEPQAPRHWRVLAIAGGVATVVQGVVAGTGLHSSALAQLDDPLHFSGIVVLLLLVAELLRRAWALRRDQPELAFRWRGAGLASLTLAMIAVFGGVTGGEGLRALGTLLAVLLVLGAEAPTEDGLGETVDFPAEEPELREAA